SPAPVTAVVTAVTAVPTAVTAVVTTASVPATATVPTAATSVAAAAPALASPTPPTAAPPGGGSRKWNGERHQGDETQNDCEPLHGRASGDEKSKPDAT